MKIVLKIVDCQARGMVELWNFADKEEMIIRMNCDSRGYLNHTDMSKRISKVCLKYTEH